MIGFAFAVFGWNIIWIIEDITKKAFLIFLYFDVSSHKFFLNRGVAQMVSAVDS